MMPGGMMGGWGYGFFGWLMMLQQHFPQSIWLNPEPQNYWDGTTIDYVRQTFEMFPLTLEGLSQGMAHLNKGIELLSTLPDTPARAQLELTLQRTLGVSLLAITQPIWSARMQQGRW